MDKIINIKDHNQDISDINTKIGDENSGLIKELNDINDALTRVDAITLNGKKFSNPMTKEEYDSIVNKDENTIYLVDDNNVVTGIPDYSNTDANKLLAINSTGTALAWIDAPNGSGTGLTAEQASQLQTAYEHSQSAHIKSSDIPTKVSQLINDSNFSTKDYVNQQISAASLGSNANFRDTNSGESFSISRVHQYAEVLHGLYNNSNLNEGTSKTINVKLKKRINCVQTVNISSNSEYLVIDKSQLTFNRKNYYTNQPVKLTAIEDSTSTEDKTVVLSFTNPDTSEVKSVTLILKNVSSSADPILVTGVSLDKSITEVPINDTIILTATISPSNATNKNVTFSSDNGNVSISQSGLTATVTGMTQGTSKITVTTEDGSYSDYIDLKITPEQVISVNSVSLNTSTKSITNGKSFTLTATISPSNATNKNVTFSSDNGNVSISQSGLTATVTGTIVGSSIVTVTTEDGNRTAQCSVTVTDIPQGSYVTDGLTNMYDLTQYEDGYVGEVRDSINNNLLTVKGQEAYNTGRCGFIKGKFMLNNYLSNSKILYSSLAIPSTSAPTAKYPHSIEVYMCMRYCYNMYQPDNSLIMNSPVENEKLLIIDTRSTDDAENAVRGSWLQYNVTSKRFIINQTLSSIYVESEPVESNLCAISSDDDLVFTHIVVVLDSNNQRVYVNGTTVIDNNKTALALSDTNSAIRFSTYGDIKLIRTYDKVLTQEEVIQNYNDVTNVMGGN